MRPQGAGGPGGLGVSSTGGTARRGARRVALALAIALPALALAPWPAAASPRIVDVRVGRHPAFTRVVIETDGPASHRVEEGSDAITVRLDAAGRARTLRDDKSRHLSRVVVSEAGADASRVRLGLRGEVSLRTLVLREPDRLVLDLYDPGAAPALAKTSAPAARPTPAPAPPTAEAASPKPVPAPPAAERAERAAPSEFDEGKAGGEAFEPRAPVTDGPLHMARAEEEARAAAPAAEPPADAPSTPSTPSTWEDLAAADRATGAPAPEDVPAEPAGSGEAPGAEAAAAGPDAPGVPSGAEGTTTPGEALPGAGPAPPLLGSKAEAETAPEAVRPPPARAGEAAPESGREAPSLLGRPWAWLTLAVLLAVVVFWLMHRRRSAEESLALGAPPEPGEPFSLDEAGAPEDADAPAAAAPEAPGTPGASAGTSASPGPEPSALPFATGAALPEAAPAAPATPSHPAAPAAAHPTVPDTPESETMEPDTSPYADAPAAPPLAAPSGAGDADPRIRELERRLAHLETRLEEVVDAKERLERQVAAQTEELRVQRAAIARTQRVLRNLTRPEDEAGDTAP